MSVFDVVVVLVVVVIVVVVVVFISRSLPFVVFCYHGRLFASVASYLKENW